LQEKAHQVSVGSESKQSLVAEQIAKNQQSALEAERLKYQTLLAKKDDMQFSMEENMSRLKERHAGAQH
jgi:hypothetical protein